jgi:hypothetical protein
MGRPGQSGYGSANCASYLDLSGMWSCAIHEDLVTTLRAKGPVHSLITYYLHGARCFHFRADPPPVETEKAAMMPIGLFRSL